MIGLPLAAVLLSMTASIEDQRLAAPVTDESIKQAQVIAVGRFMINRSEKPVDSDFETQDGNKLKGTSVVLPFRVTTSIPAGLSVLSVRLFSPAEPKIVRLWDLPLEENLLLFLKRDPMNPDSYVLMTPRTGWLVMPKSDSISNVPQLDPSKLIRAGAAGFLEERATDNSQIMYFDSFNFGEPRTVKFGQNDPATENALNAILSLHLYDQSLQGPIGVLATQPGQIGLISRLLLQSGGDFSVETERLQELKEGKLDSLAAGNLPYEIFQVIVHSDLDKSRPFAETALGSGDPVIRVQVIRALKTFHDPRLLSLFAKCLGDSNRDVEYAAMAGIYYIEQPDDLVFPSVPLFLKDPDAYIAKYQAWVTNNQQRLALIPRN